MNVPTEILITLNNGTDGREISRAVLPFDAAAVRRHLAYFGGAVIEDPATANGGRVTIELIPLPAGAAHGTDGAPEP